MAARAESGADSGADFGWPSASARRANALVLGRWFGVVAIIASLFYQLLTKASPLVMVALACAAAVVGLNLYQRQQLQAFPKGPPQPAPPQTTELVDRVRLVGRVLLLIDSALIVLTALSLAHEPSGSFWALLGWLPVEGAIAEGTATALVSGGIAVAGVLAYDAVQRHAPPNLSPSHGVFVRVVDLVGVTLVMVAMERTLADGELVMAARADALETAVERERVARREREAFSETVLAGVRNQGNLDGVLQSMTEQVASTLDYERMAIFLLEEPGRMRCRSWFGDWQGSPSVALRVGPGSIVGRVAATGVGIRVSDPKRHPDYYALIPDTQSEICAPLHVGNNIFGVVNVESPRPGAFSDADLDRLQRLADQIAVVIDNAYLVDALRDSVEREAASRREIEAVSRAVMAGVKLASYQGALDHMLAEVATVLELEALCYVTPDENGRLRIRGAVGFPAELIRRRPLVPEGGITGRVFVTERPLRSNTSEDGLLSRDGRLGTASELGVPVRVEGNLLGVLTAKANRQDAFSEDDMARLSRIADQLAVVIERARLVEGEAQTTERLRQLDQLRDDFVAMTTHELRTPLTVIRGFTATLLRPDLHLNEDEQRHFVEVIDRQTARLARLVEDLLLVSRMEAGILEVTLGVHDSAKLLTDYAEEWSTEPSRVLLDLGPDLPYLRTDPDRLAQVMRNLVDNALRYGGDAPVRVVAYRAGIDLVVEVRDQGPGIAPTELPHVFERFHQSGSSSAHRAGMGLGLYITRELVRVLGGTIGVESSPGRGTVFQVRLPGERARPLSARSNVAPFRRAT